MECGKEYSRRHQRTPHDSSNMSPMKTNSGREREKERERERERSRRTHKSSTRHSRTKGKDTRGKRSSGLSTSRDATSDGRLHQQRARSNHRNSSPSSSSSEGEENIPDHRTVLATANPRLTSPSMVSNLTSLTSGTNTSSGSSGSNSTVTQASITKRSNSGKRPEMPETPAVPDAPDVFAFLEHDPTSDPENDNIRTRDPEREDKSQWLEKHVPDQIHEPSLPLPVSHELASTSSSSSSFRGDDNFSEPAADRDTDRSTSPDNSIQGQEDDDHSVVASDTASAKIASQIAAAQQRQNLHGAVQSFGTPNIQPGNTGLPQIPSQSLNSRYSQSVSSRGLPRAEKLPVTGYELLASRLSSYSGSETVKGAPRIKPMYRKFEALNHRILLHLQDEISELEEQLHRLDHADTQSRKTDHQILPASRRAAAFAGGELQWHKTDVLGRIGYKLAQYSTSSSLPISIYHLLMNSQTKLLPPSLLPNPSPPPLQTT